MASEGSAAACEHGEDCLRLACHLDDDGPYHLAVEFTKALDERGLPGHATLADLIQHERGQMGMQVAFEFMTTMERAANRLVMEGDTHGAEAIRKAVREGAPPGGE